MLHFFLHPPKNHLMETSNYGMGWLPDLPDFRDYTADSTVVPAKLQAVGRTETVKAMLASANIKGSKPAKAPTTADLRSWCSPIEDQGSIGSCTAHAGVGMIEYFENRAFGRHLDASRLFLYKVTRNMLGWTGDTGLFCAPPWERWLCLAHHQNPTGRMSSANTIRSRVLSCMPTGKVFRPFSFTASTRRVLLVLIFSQV